jgi:hypothetical protein
MTFRMPFEFGNIVPVPNQAASEQRPEIVVGNRLQSRQSRPRGDGRHHHPPHRRGRTARQARSGTKLLQQIERVQRLPRANQRFATEIFDTVNCIDDPGHGSEVRLTGRKG